MSRITTMTEGKPLKLILSFAFPLILTNLGQQLYMIVDASVVGRGLGVKALAAVGATDWCYWLILWTVTGVTQAFSTFVSRYFGEKNYEKMNKAITMSAVLCLAIGVILTAFGCIFAKPLLTLLHTPDDILDGAVVYLVTMSAGTLAVIAYNMSASILRAMGDGKSPLVAMIIAGLLNIGLDLLFVLVFHMGIFGAAIASVIAQFISFLYCLNCIRKVSCVQLKRDTWKLDFAELKRQLAFGLPITAQFLLIAISGIVVQSTINLQGSIFIAGYTATNKVYGMLESTAQSFGQAFCTYFAQNYGAGKKDRVKSGVNTALKIVSVSAVCVMTLMFLCGKLVLQMFISAGEADGTAALGIAWKFLAVRVICLIICYLIHVYRNVMQGIGNAFWPMISGIAEGGLRVLVGTVCFTFWGKTALYFAEPAAWIGAMLACALPYYLLRNKLLKSERKGKEI